jgi:hypothetical protein
MQCVDLGVGTRGTMESDEKALSEKIRSGPVGAVETPHHLPSSSSVMLDRKLSPIVVVGCAAWLWNLRQSASTADRFLYQVERL